MGPGVYCLLGEVDGVDGFQYGADLIEFDQGPIGHAPVNAFPNACHMGGEQLLKSLRQSGARRYLNHQTKMFSLCCSHCFHIG